jgi:hypothetical protein
MPVISLSGQDVGAGLELHSILRAQDPPKPEPASEEPQDEIVDQQEDRPRAGRSMHASSSSMDFGFGSRSRSRTKTSPTPVSPVLESPPGTSASSSRPIPPPPTPRRHKSGILMSRVRAHTSGSTFKSSSRSFGDLSESALGMSHMGDIGIGSSNSAGNSPSKRIVSEGGRKAREESEEDDDDDMWDNR